MNGAVRTAGLAALLAATQAFAVPPTTTSIGTSAVTGTSATLMGSADPNSVATDGWFRFATVDPGACDDVFGTRAPAVGGTALGAGAGAVAYSEVIAGLTPGMTYYFCAIAASVDGTSFGSVLSFTTPVPPAATTGAATLVTPTTASLNGSGTPNLSDSGGWFRYSSTNPGACDDSFGSRAPANGEVSLGAGAGPVAFVEALRGLSPGTTYYFCAIAASAGGTAFGPMASFATAAATAPEVTTQAATDVEGTSATIGATANPIGSAATGWFRYDTTDPGICSDSFGVRAPATFALPLGPGTIAAAYSASLLGLEPLITYYYCAVASNAVGMAFGAVMSFTTLEAPPIVKDLVIHVGGGTMNAVANPRGSETTVWFRYDSTDPGACTDDFGTRVPAIDGEIVGAGHADVMSMQPLDALAPGKYYACAFASSVAGVSATEVVSFDVTVVASGCACSADGRGAGSSMGALAALAFASCVRLRRRAPARHVHP